MLRRRMWMISLVMTVWIMKVVMMMLRQRG